MNKNRRPRRSTKTFDTNDRLNRKKRMCILSLDIVATHRRAINWGVEEGNQDNRKARRTAPMVLRVSRLEEWKTRERGETK